MPAHFSRTLIDRLLNDDEKGLRLIQDLPVLADVWVAYAGDPEGRFQLLFSPGGRRSPAQVAKIFAEAFNKRRQDEPAYIAPLQGLITATLNFEQLIELAAPMLGLKFRLLSPSEAADILARLDLPNDARTTREADAAPNLEARTSALIAMIAYGRHMTGSPATFDAVAAQLRSLPKSAKSPIAAGDFAPRTDPPLLRRVTLNRRVVRMASESVRTVKADAARRVFQTSGSDLIWAVIDSGIDDTHPAFALPPAERDENDPDKTRVWRAYDFSRLRRLSSFDILLDETSDAFKALLRDAKTWLKAAPTYQEDDGDGRRVAALDLLRQFRADAEHERQPSWPLLERFLRLPRKTPPAQPHGTHVAGILAGDWPEQDFVGVCPDLRLLDIRILGTSEEETEASIIGSLEFIRWLNSRNRWRIVHGANLSIGMKHDVRNWACGQTPICVACEDLVASGVVVVAAAGNDGWQSFLVGDEKRYEGYALASIMDPGNAQSVITVGATHREQPHLYGVSFFSSRGPTGDGRMKPDLLAPGEKIEAPLPNADLGTLDGTSMAAPHVSGVAALLMARHNELRGRPAEIKQILMETAIDLGRERAAQGAGLVDALAALQRR